MSKTVLGASRRVVLLGLCIALLLTVSLILAPVVGAASDTKTETENQDTNDIMSAEDALLTQRAITIDEAKKEAQAVVSEQLAIKAAAKEAEAEATEAPEQTQSTDTELESSYTEPETTADSSSSSGEETGSDNTVQASYSYGYLMDIDNPDPNYVAYSISLSDTDRDMAERIIMGEAGNQGYTGMALVAQCIRDTYVNGNYSSMAQLIAQNGYYGSTSITPSQTCKDVVSYIFDQGGSAVQHSIRVFYASNYCSSPWHEAQVYVCSYGYVRFFDL